MKTILKFQTIALICISSILFTTITSCQKEGTGGNSTIIGYVKHHEKFIPNATVYIKYNATEFPGTNTANYDASIIAGSNALYKFTNLRKGDYYLYAIGYDDVILSQVQGGIAVKLKYNKTTITDVPVTE